VDLPDNRMELYDVALQMLLERRDADRRIPPLPGLNRTRKTLLIADLAYWLIRNDLTDAEVSRAVEQLGRRLNGMPEVRAEAESVYRHLLERSGLLREPVDGRVDFVHRTFQEHLAARAATVDTDDVGTLVSHGHLDQWHKVIVMAAGHASRAQREELLKGILQRGDLERVNRHTLHLLAVACLETSPELDPSLRAEIGQRAASLLPPKSLGAARAFASAGLFVLDLLASTQPRNAREAAATIRAAAEMGVDEALPVLSRFAEDTRGIVQSELVMAWPRFDAEIYAQQVLSSLPIRSLNVHDPAIVPSVRHLRHVTELSCSVPPLGKLDFVPRQVTKLRLVALGLVDLSTLNTPSLTDFSLSDGQLVDVGPLATLPELASFTSTSRQLRHLSALSAVKGLRRLALLGGCSASDLNGFGLGWPLESLALANVIGLTDLAPLGFLANPRELRLEGCPQLRRLEGVRSSWASSLEKLALCHCTLENLIPLATLTKLSELDLYGSLVADLTPLIHLTHLKKLTVSSSRTVRDLAPVTRLTHLRELRISQGGPVNLAGFAGVRNLTIKIEGATQINGAGKLGAGSLIERWDRK
jgi:Leucine-rich repeat (LRR) protein